jgi:hypothetical protein
MRISLAASACSLRLRRAIQILRRLAKLGELAFVDDDGEFAEDALDGGGDGHGLGNG